MTDLARLDVASVRLFLAGRFPNLSQVAALDGGAWSQAFSFQRDGRDLVVRFGRYGDHYAKDRVAGSWRRAHLPAPEVVEIGGALDGTFAVSTRVVGGPIEALDEKDWLRVLPSVFEALSAMRDITAPGTGFGSWTEDGATPCLSWREWLLTTAAGRPESRIRGWQDQLRAVPGAQARFDAGHAHLAALVDECPELRNVVHTDLTAGNTFVEGGHLTGILDWGNSIVGDPLYDIAHLTFWAPWHRGTRGLDLRSMARDFFHDDRFDERLRCYEVHIGLDAQQYSAFTSRWDELESTAARTLELAKR
jgi:aminoglycoside phosphotransferase (APT) family kinase protein